MPDLYRTCSRCACSYPAGERCPCKPVGTTSWDGTRDRQTQRDFRSTVLALAGHRCQWMDRAVRCSETTGLEAHHTEPGNHDPLTGLCLCERHHEQEDPHARRKRK